MWELNYEVAQVSSMEQKSRGPRLSRLAEWISVSLNSNSPAALEFHHFFTEDKTYHLNDSTTTINQLFASWQLCLWFIFGTRSKKQEEERRNEGDWTAFLINPTIPHLA